MTLCDHVVKIVLMRLEAKPAGVEPLLLEMLLISLTVTPAGGTKAGEVASCALALVGALLQETDVSTVSVTERVILKFQVTPPDLFTLDPDCSNRDLRS